MKLRIKGDSLRLRISPSEIARLLDQERVEETIHFGPDEDARLTYAVELSATAGETTVRHRTCDVTVVVPSSAARAWAAGNEVGIYATVGVLEVAIEKDFACLDKSDADNRDTYPHPHAGKAC